MGVDTNVAGKSIPKISRWWYWKNLTVTYLVVLNNIYRMIDHDTDQMNKDFLLNVYINDTWFIW